MNLKSHFQRNSGGRVQGSSGQGRAGFTMVEIAICLAVIAFALVAIIGVLPIGISVQKDNREETIINFDARYLMDTIRNGAQDTNSQGAQSLTNYINSITVTSVLCDSNGAPVPPGTVFFWQYTTTNYTIGTTATPICVLTNNFNIVGLLSLPKYTYNGNGNFNSNMVTADIRAITGSTVDQGASQSSRDFAFTYRVSVEVIPSAQFPYAISDNHMENFTAPGITVKNDAAHTGDWVTARNLQQNLQEIRLRFRWPVLPNGQVGPGSQTYRTLVSGYFGTPQNASVPGQTLVFNQGQGYTNAP